MFGRGVVPGLSFLFYTMVFYTHYQQEYLDTLSIIYYERLKEFVGKIHEYDWSDFSLDEYRDIFFYLNERASSAFEKLDVHSFFDGALVKTLVQKVAILYSKLGEAYVSYKREIVIFVSRVKSALTDEFPDFEKLRGYFEGLQKWFARGYNVLKRNFSLYYGSLVKKWADFIE